MPAVPPPPSAGATAPAAETAQYVREVADLVNAERVKAGCTVMVKVNSKLTQAAQAHSEDQDRRQTMTHSGSDGSQADARIKAAGYSWSNWGENVAVSPSATAVMAAWMNSPGHRSNILNCAYQDIGVGFSAAKGGPWWTQVFATPR
ncbi:CAP domain-containing protein (plasmid) [Kitasatospora sp. NBC_00070]|uniref:CAP domain-containing protein n=1 Tax=Kitasatospora sp. NBC_00070 TaxID=2975962 RepID=UPI002F910ED8